MDDPRFLFTALASDWSGLLGWAGTLIYLVNHGAYSLRSSYHRRLYLGANAVAALLVTISSVMIESWQSGAINAFWTVVSIQGLAGAHFRLRLFPPAWFDALLAGVLAISLAALALSTRLSADLLGWSSMLAFCGAYLMLANRVIGEVRYFAYNAIAAFIILPVLWLDNNWPIFALEACWTVLSLAALVRCFTQKEPSEKPAQPEAGASDSARP